MSLKYVFLYYYFYLLLSGRILSRPCAWDFFFSLHGGYPTYTPIVVDLKQAIFHSFSLLCLLFECLHGGPMHQIASGCLVNLSNGVSVQTSL